MKNEKKVRAGEKLIGEGWFVDEKEVTAWIMARRVLVDDALVRSAHELVPACGTVRIKEYYKTKYVNKGGLKLEKAIADFSLDIAGKTALDCGASAGGFTDCLLQHGAKEVYAVDAGHGQLAGKLLGDGRAVNMENTNLSDPALKDLDPPPELITLDLSYLSLRDAVPVCEGILARGGVIVCLVKPIYEVASPEIRRTGKINDPELIQGVLADLCAHFAGSGWRILGMTNSPVRGNRGAMEFFIALTKSAAYGNDINGSYNEHISVSVRAAEVLAEFDKNSYSN